MVSLHHCVLLALGLRCNEWATISFVLFAALVRRPDTLWTVAWPLNTMQSLAFLLLRAWFHFAICSSSLAFSRLSLFLSSSLYLFTFFFSLLIFLCWLCPLSFFSHFFFSLFFLSFFLSFFSPFFPSFFFRCRFVIYFIPAQTPSRF